MYGGELDAGDIYAPLYTREARELIFAIEKAFSEVRGDLSADDTVFLETMRRNTYVFSAFKNHQFSRAVHALLFDEGGELIPFNRFRDQVLEQFGDDYYVHWLKAEYDTAIGAGQMAGRWREHTDNADLFPALQYSTVGDDRVRAEHAALDGITRPIEDPFWDTHYPPNGWRCRCDVIATAGGETPIPEGLPTNPAGFNNNPGKSASIVSPDHPYFNVDSQTAQDIAKAVDQDLDNA